MRVAVVTIALRLPADPSRWITVPPPGYSGIHWVVAHLVDGLLSLGHDVTLLGAPGSPVSHRNLTVVNVGEVADTERWLANAAVDVVHDHSCGQLDASVLPAGVPYLSTHHLTGRPAFPQNCVYLSAAQRRAAGSVSAPAIPIPVNDRYYPFRRDKDDYLLFMGRVSKFKGAYEAAAFAQAAGRRLVIAGPSWEEDYRRRIEVQFGPMVTFEGEVGGRRRVDLFARAAAVMVMSQTVMGPWGQLWCEPGATVVSEAAVSGTPIIATGNGCLSEIVPPVGAVVPEGASFSAVQARGVLSALPKPDQVRREAMERWGYVRIAKRYDELYRRLLEGERWV